PRASGGHPATGAPEPGDRQPFGEMLMRMPVVVIGNGVGGYVVVEEHCPSAVRRRCFHVRVVTGASSVPGSDTGATRFSSGAGSSGGSTAVSVAGASYARKPPDWCFQSLA